MKTFQIQNDPVLGKNDIMYHVTLLGSQGCGKTAFLNRLKNTQETNVPIEELSKLKMNKMTIKIFDSKAKSIYLRLFDPSGHEDFVRVRDLTIPSSDYLILLFDVSNSDSFEEANQVFTKIIFRKGKLGSRVVLVASKIDLFDKKSVTDAKTEELKRSLNALEYVKCNSISGLGIDHTVQVIIKDILKRESVDTTPWWNFCCCTL